MFVHHIFISLYLEIWTNANMIHRSQYEGYIFFCYRKTAVLDGKFVIIAQIKYGYIVNMKDTRKLFISNTHLYVTL